MRFMCANSALAIAPGRLEKMTSQERAAIDKFRTRNAANPAPRLKVEKGKRISLRHGLYTRQALDERRQLGALDQRCPQARSGYRGQRLNVPLGFVGPALPFNL
jgi:hypothetical protein